MNCGVIYLIVGMLCLWPLGISAGQSPTPAEIQRVQARLKAVGLDPGPLDGTWGPQTEAALRTYQQQRGLPVSGQLDDATRQALLSASAAPEAVQEAQTPRAVPQERPEQQRSAHDRSEVFQALQALPSSPAFVDQPDEGKVLGFEFARDPLNAKRPMQTFDETMQVDVQAKPGVTAAQQRLLERRYELTPRFDPEYRMSRGKPLPIGPTARLAPGRTWESLAQMTPESIRQANVFPYPSLPHPKQATGGQVFPRMQLLMFPRLERFDVDFDLPEAFLPEFPPALFLQNRPELGDVSRGEVVSINNFYRLFKDLLTPVQLDGLRLLLTPFPQEEFNPTDDRKSMHASLGVTCLDCHVNGHTTGQFHLNPDDRPQERRFRLDTVSLRGLFNQQLHAQSAAYARSRTSPSSNSAPPTLTGTRSMP
jgi:hypothetical protein